MSGGRDFISFSCKPESVRQDVECGWCGGFPLDRRGRRGWIPRLSYSGKEGGHVPVCSHYGMAAAVEIRHGGGHGGPCGVTRSYHHIGSCWGWAGLCGRTRAGKTRCTLLRRARQMPTAVDPLRSAGANARPKRAFRSETSHSKKVKWRADEDFSALTSEIWPRLTHKASLSLLLPRLLSTAATSFAALSNVFPLPVFPINSFVSSAFPICVDPAASFLSWITGCILYVGWAVHASHKPL